MKDVEYMVKVTEQVRSEEVIFSYDNDGDYRRYRFQRYFGRYDEELEEETNEWGNWFLVTDCEIDRMPEFLDETDAKALVNCFKELNK